MGEENLATECLAHILNKSAASMQELNNLLCDTDFNMEPISRVSTQESYNNDHFRPDMTGYDKNGLRHLIVEAKFGARLLTGQASAYVELLHKDGPGVLLFIVPEYRVEEIWDEVIRQFGDGGENRQLETIEHIGRMQRAQVVDTEWRLKLVSWRSLLESMAHHVKESGERQVIEADILELRGLTEQMDSKEFQPIRDGDYSKELGQRVSDLEAIFDAVVTKLKEVDWVNTEGLSRSRSIWEGYGHYLRLSGKDSWFGVYYQIWADSATEDTPLWVKLYECSDSALNEVARKLQAQLYAGPRGPRLEYIPIRLRKAVEWKAVIDDVLRQLEEIAEVIKTHG